MYNRDILMIVLNLLCLPRTPEVDLLTDILGSAHVAEQNT
jgi:hypothetical protein